MTTDSTEVKNGELIIILYSGSNFAKQTDISNKVRKKLTEALNGTTLQLHLVRIEK